MSSKVLICVLLAVVVGALYAWYWSRASGSTYISSYVTKPQNGAEVFELKPFHIERYKQADVVLNPTEGGAPIIKTSVLGFLFPGGVTFDEGVRLTNRQQESVLSLQVLIQNMTILPGEYQFANPSPSSKHPPTPHYSQPEISFLLEEDHLTLLKQLNVKWIDFLFAPGVNPKRPFLAGATAFETDMADLLGIKYSRGSTGFIFEKHDEDRLFRLYDEMVPAMQVMLRYGQINPGLYTRSDEFSVWSPVK